VNQAQHIIKGWSFQNLLFEYYRYAPCPAEWMPMHCHDEYQFCLSLDCPGEYEYRRTHYWVPAASLSILHPGEMHTGRDIVDRQTDATFRMLYVSQSVMQTVIAEMEDCTTDLPFFSNPIILDTDLARRFLTFHTASASSVSRLEQDALLLTVLAESIQRYADNPPAPRPIRRERQAVRQVRDYLHDRAGENVTLDRLAQIVHLSPYYLSRVFRAEVGVSLQRYQTQVRINRSKLLLAQGMAIHQVAAQTGFVDQSHFTHQFRRTVQVTPGQYQRKTGGNSQKQRKDLQDSVDQAE
jgi:AraC-like DNA-binding protein